MMLAMPAPSLDGRAFAMVSSTASAVDDAAPTVFRYHERDGMVWGEYDGDTVRLGRFVGSRRADQVSLAFVHLLGETGELISGDAHSTVRLAPDGAVELIETFGEGGTHTSVCRELAG